MGLVALLFLLPLLNVLACSFSSPEKVVAGEVGLFPVEFNVRGYQEVFANDSLMRGFLNTLFYTFLGTVIQVTLQMLCAYPLSRPDFKGRKFLNIFLTLTMFVSGGMIPTYLLISNLGMLDTIWAIIIPGCVSVFNIIVIRTYMQNSIPAELQEAARIDGCGDFQIFLRVVLPLCRPILFVMVLYAIVGYWNNYFNALLYIQSTDLYPLQRVLQDMLVTNSGSLGAGDPNLQEQLKYVTIVVSSLPLLIIYPFFQKYFEKGVTIGEHTIDFKAGYRRLPILEAIREYAGVDVKGMDEDQLRETCKKLGVEIDPSMGKGKLIDAIFGAYAEDKLIEPTFITDYPVEMSPLTKRHRDDDTLTERFELFVCGKELANAYSELNDPIDQLERFEEQARLKSKGDDEAMFIDYDFVRALEYGMPPTSGLGMGIDRLTMFMTGQTTIQDVLFFPQMRPEKIVKASE